MNFWGELVEEVVAGEVAVEAELEVKAEEVGFRFVDDSPISTTIRASSAFKLPRRGPAFDDVL